MAQKVSFDAYLGWVNITNPNQIPADARVIGANDLLRYEKLGQDTAKKFVEVDQTLEGMKSDAVVADMIADPNSETRYTVESMVKTGVAKFQEVIDKVPADVTAQVQPLVAKAIAEDRTITEAAVTAVGKELQQAGLVGGAAAGRTTEAAGGFIGENDRLTDLVIDKNGDVPDFVLLDRWAPRLGITDVVKGSLQGYTTAAAGGFVGDNDRLTELVVDSNGNVPASVLSRWASRMNITAPTDPTPVANPFASQLPIVTIGDSQTGAAYDNVKWPTVMQEALGLPAEAVQNCGYPGETSVAIAAKMGAIPAVWPAGGTIPASGMVEVIVKDHVDMLRWWAAMPCTLAGVPGVLSRNPNQDGNAGSLDFPARFTRSKAGAAVTVPPNAPFIPDNIKFRGCMAILMVGRNNQGDTARVLSDTRAIVENLTALDGKYLVLSQITGGTSAINTAYEATYGPRYLDVKSYLASEKAILDAGLTPTAADKTAIAGKNVPPVFLSDNVHMNGVGLTRQGHFVAQHLIGKGWL